MERFEFYISAAKNFSWSIYGTNVTDSDIDPDSLVFISAIDLSNQEALITGIGRLNGKNWPNSASSLNNKRTIGELAEFGQFLPFKRPDSCALISAFSGYKWYPEIM